MTLNMDLQGQVALVTGAAAGIGKAIAGQLGAAGATVAVTDVDQKAAETVAAAIPNARAYRLDVTSAQEAGSVAKAVESDLGPIDILANNAGVASMKYVWDLTEEDWDFNFDVNAKGVFLVTSAVIPGMMARKRGSIVNTASMAGKKGPALLSHYAASKWACIGFTKSCATELGPYGIRVNCVCPGYVATPMQERELGWESEARGMTVQEVFDGYIAQTPLGRIETPDDVARVVVYLASPAAEFLTGAAIDITGGAHLP
jgi:NAD(P)-dependent dehydrogenase (short-subunit alcohol dehydrogenase family)